MSLSGLYAQREKFEKFDLSLSNTRSKVKELQSKADDARKEPETASMTAELNAGIDIHEEDVLNADRQAREASDNHATVCRSVASNAFCARSRCSVNWADHAMNAERNDAGCIDRELRRPSKRTPLLVANRPVSSPLGVPRAR